MAAETDDDLLLDDLRGEVEDDRPRRRSSRPRRTRGRGRGRAAGAEPDRLAAGEPRPGEPRPGEPRPRDPVDEAPLFGPAEPSDDRPVAGDAPVEPPSSDEEPSHDEEDDAPAEPRSRRSRGRRTALRRRRRRRSIAKGLGAGLLTLAAASAVVWAAGTLDLGSEPEAQPSAPAPVDADGVVLDPQPTAVLATFDESGPSRAATQIAVLAWDRETGAATVLLVPTGITTDLPGHGVGSLGDALAIGDGPLLDAAIDNLLALDLDVTVGISRQAWASLFTRVGGLTVEVPERLRVRNDDGSATVRFAEGVQFLDGPRLAELLTLRTPGERELEALPRVQLVLLTLFDAVASNPEHLDAIFADGAPMLELASPETDVETLRTLFVELAAAHTRGDLVVRTLPVTPLGSGEVDTYRLDEARAAQLVEDRFVSSRPTIATDGGGRRLEIRNGNGVAGVSSEVSQTLIPLGFRVLLTGNADDFEHETTRILVYEDSEEQLEVAREVREALGLGRIAISEVPQDVVDITIVVGSDYLEDRG